MVARSSIFQTIQIGPESVAPGTAAAADIQLTGLSIEPGPKVDISKYRAMGVKFQGVSALNKEWIEASVSGPITYTELVYPLSGIFTRVTPVLGTVAYTWTFNINASSEDNPMTFTVEQGSSLRAHRFTYGLFNAFNMKFSRSGNEVGGTMIGAALEDGITMTATPTALGLVPVQPTEVAIRIADTYAGLGAAPVLSRALEYNYEIADRYSMLYALNGSTSWATHVETAPAITASLLLEANAEGMGFLTDMRNGDFVFIRASATGPTIAGAEDYSFECDLAARVVDVDPFSDQDGVYAINWKFEAFLDPTWGDATEIRIINNLASL